MEEQAVRGVPWALLTFAAGKVVTLGTTVVLARLLTPRDFGVVSLGFLVIGILSVVSDLGLGGVLVAYGDELDERARGTILSILLIAGVVISIGLAATAPLFAWVFDEHRLLNVQLGLAPAGLLGAINWYHQALLQRALAFRPLFFISMAQVVAYAGTAVVLAALGAGVWALVAGQMVGAAVQAVTSLALTVERTRPTWVRERVGELLRSSSAFIVQGVTSFAEQNADYVIVGRVLGAQKLGFYTLAYRIGELPLLGISEPVARVTFPGFVRMRERGEPVDGVFLSTLGTIALLCTPVGVIVAAVADPFVRLVYGTDWLPMIAALSVLGLWGALRPLQSTLAWLLNSVGASGQAARIAVWALVVAVPVLVAAAELDGIRGVAWAMTAQSLGTIVFYVRAVSRHGDVPARAQVLALVPVAGAALPCWVAARLVADAAGAPVIGVLGGTAAGLVAYVAALAVVGRPLLFGAVRRGVAIVRPRPAT